MFIANFMTSGTGFYLFNAFMQPLASRRGWTYTEISYALVIGPAVGLVSQLFYGSILYKTGPRIIMALGPILSGISFIMIGRVDNIWLFYLYFVLLDLGNGAMAGIAAGTAVNNWFVKKRGKATGFATAGISLSGVILPYSALLLLEKGDLSQTCFIIGVSTLAVSPFAWFIIRDWPEKYGMRPDGLPPESSLAETKIIENDRQDYFFDMDDIRAPRWTFSKLIRNDAFWKIGLSFTMVMTGVAGVMSQLKPRFNHLGFDDRSAMALMAATAMFGMCGKFFWGTLCDRMDPKRVVSIIMAGGGLGIGINLAGSSNILLVLFVVIYGFSMGGMLATIPVMIATFFGRYSFAAVVKFLAIFMFFQGLGPIAMGRSYDLTGSYNAAYMFFVALNLIGAVLISTAKRPEMSDLTG